MSPKLAGTFVLLVLLLMPSPAFPQDTDAARRFVQQVYADYSNPDTNHQEARQSKFYTPGLYHLILSDRKGHPGDVGNLDGDPICDCQDPGDPGDLKVKSIAISASGHSRITAIVAFAILTDPRTVKLSLLSTPSGWRIDDISTEGMPSLRRLLLPKAKRH
jgi:hypothetical protein